FISIAMTRPARHHLTSAEVGSINVGNHRDHRARHSLSRGIRWPVDLVRARTDVTIGAVELEGGRHDSHRPQEIVYRNSLEHLDILEDLFRQKRFLLWPKLRRPSPGTYEPDNCDSGGRENAAAGPEPDSLTA